MTTIYIILILLFVLLYLQKNNYENFQQTKINKNEKYKLVTLLYLFHKLCEDDNIIYYIAYGTLLGAVRHWGMIPHDDDIDIIVWYKDKERIHEIMNMLEQEFHYKIYHDYKLSRVYVTDKLFMDIFYVKEENNKILRCSDDNNSCYVLSKDQTWWSNGFEFPSYLLQQRKKYQYEDIMVYGPKEANIILQKWYGSNYLTTCKTHYLEDHEKYVEQKIINCGDLPKPQL